MAFPYSLHKKKKRAAGLVNVLQKGVSQKGSPETAWQKGPTNLRNSRIVIRV